MLSTALACEEGIRMETDLPAKFNLLNTEYYRKANTTLPSHLLFFRRLMTSCETGFHENISYMYVQYFAGASWGAIRILNPRHVCVCVYATLIFDYIRRAYQLTSFFFLLGLGRCIYARCHAAFSFSAYGAYWTHCTVHEGLELSWRDISVAISSSLDACWYYEVNNLIGRLSFWDVVWNQELSHISSYAILGYERRSQFSGR